jgi:D-alanine-D-alanine ligase
MAQVRVLILYNEPVLPVGHQDYESEYEILSTVEAVERNLLGGGREVARLGIRSDPVVLLDGLRDQRPDVVFNLYEGTAEQGQTEAFVAGLLEWSGVPFTGCPAQALSLARSKHLAKHMFLGARLPTPAFRVAEDACTDCSGLCWPLIVKPAHQDASVGVDQGSVVTDKRALAERVDKLVRSYGPPVLIEEFIEGRELDVGVVEMPELRALPVSEVVFSDEPSFWPIVTYDGKWKPGSRDFEATPAQHPADVEPELGIRLQALAQRAFRLLGCRDYARVDFRVSPRGEIFLLEVNPNPDFHPTAGLAGGLASAGLSYPQFTIDLVMHALERRQPVVTSSCQQE